MKTLNGEILMCYNRNCTLMNSEFCESTHQGNPQIIGIFKTNIEINYHRILIFFFNVKSDINLRNLKEIG